MLPDRRAPGPGWRRMDAHKFFEAIDLSHLDLNSPLSLRAALEVVDGNRLAADRKQAGVRLGEPIVKARSGNTEPVGGFLCTQQRYVVH